MNRVGNAEPPAAPLKITEPRKPGQSEPARYLRQE